MIVKDEEEVLERCLESVKDCVDEVIIVDTGSTDGTKEIAYRYTQAVYDYAWQDDFAATRNFSFLKATGDYLLWLDADDILPATEREKFPAIRRLLESQSPDMLFLPYDVGEQTLSQCFFRERIIKRTAGFVWQGCVHECIVPSGKILNAEMRIRHLGSNKDRSERNLNIYRKYVTKGNALSPRDRFYYGRELYYHHLYEEAIAIFSPLFQDKSAWYVNQIEACKIASLCHLALGQRVAAEDALFRSFRYGEPRASILCEIGTLFRKQNRYREAAFWLTSALYCRDHSKEGDFDSPADRFLRPLLELTCVYFAMGDNQKALFCHKQVEGKFPDHPSVRFNRTFFKNKGLL